MSTERKILLLDDHSLYLQGIRRIITGMNSDYHVSSFKSIADLKSSRPNWDEISLFISDIELPGEDVFKFFGELKSNCPNLPVLVISMHKKLSVLKKCKDLGIEGYLMKDDDLLFEGTIKKLLNNDVFYSPRVESYYKSFITDDFIITPREEEILKAICGGRSNHEIADQLCISIETVKTHKKNIKSKLLCETTSELIQYAQNHLLV